VSTSATVISTTLVIFQYPFIFTDKPRLPNRRHGATKKRPKKKKNVVFTKGYEAIRYEVPMAKSPKPEEPEARIARTRVNNGFARAAAKFAISRN
jgi:hypothetical protein